MKKIKLRHWRFSIALSCLGILWFCTRNEVALGSLCALCPIGFLQVCLAGRSVPVGLIWSLVGVIVFVIIAGRAFCSWLCPTIVIQSINKPSDKSKGTCSAACGKPGGIGGVVMLGGLLLASFVVQFPVFCLFCPLGLFFGFIFAINRLFVFYDPSWDLVIFPLILFIEIVWLRSWCSKICPIGAMFQLISRCVPTILQPRINQDQCLQSKGVPCYSCQQACPQQIDLRKGAKGELVNCTLCLECKDACPQQAIDLWGSRKKTKIEQRDSLSN